MAELSTYAHIQVTTEDGLLLSGLYKPGEQTKTAYIFIHGFTADFYSHAFYHAMTETLSAQGHAIILIQTRGSGLQSEVLTSTGGESYLGSYFEKIEDAHLDISAFAGFLREQGYDNIGLIGHSLGTIKAVRYLFKGEYAKQIETLILLAPFDKDAWMQRKFGQSWQPLVEQAKVKISEGKSREAVSVPEFEDFPMSYQTYVSWYHQSELSQMFNFYQPEYDFPALKKISIPTLVVLGSLDPFVIFPEFNESPESVLETFRRTIPTVQTALIENSGHTFHGHEEELQEVLRQFESFSSSNGS
jgi:pimeloyl-ACP methyl ester carboxylesterase